MNLSKSQIEEHFSSPVWKAIAAKIEAELRGADILLENPDPFLHGKAVGKREMLRLMLGYQQILLTEAGGNSPYQGRATSDGHATRV